MSDLAGIAGVAGIAGIAEAFQETVASGSLLLALPVAGLAGLVSFLSPCVLPLVPGYLSYVTGLVGIDLGQGGAPARSGGQAAGGGAAVGGPAASGGRAAVLTRSDVATRSRLLLGSALFVAGFSVVFISFGALFGELGALLIEYQQLITRVLGALTVVLGLGFLGLLPGLQRDVRLHRRPPAGLLGAPMLGVLFGLGWAPCIGPTLGAILSLSVESASAGRGAVLTAAYCAGLGLPFLLAALAYRRALGSLRWVRRHSAAVVRLGGAMLVAIGLLLSTGTWGELTRSLQSWITGFETVL